MSFNMSQKDMVKYLSSLYNDTYKSEVVSLIHKGFKVFSYEDVNIPYTARVPAIDGLNTVCDRMVTEIAPFFRKWQTQEDYKRDVAIQCVDGKYYIKPSLLL